MADHQTTIRVLRTAASEAELTDLDQLETAGVETVGDLVEAIAETNTPLEIRRIAAWAVGRLKVTDSLAALGHAVRSEVDSSLSWEAVKALCAMNQGLELFVELLPAAQKESTRCAAAWGLGCLMSPKAVPELCKAVSSSTEAASVRGHAAEALGYIRDPDSFDALAEATRVAEPVIRYWAAFALGQLGDARAESILMQMANTDTADLPGRGPIATEALAALEELRHRSRE